MRLRVVGSVRGEPAVVQGGEDRVTDVVQRAQRFDAVAARQVGGVERGAAAHVVEEPGRGAEEVGAVDTDLHRESGTAAVERDELLDVLDDEALEALARCQGDLHREDGGVLGEGERHRLRDGGSCEVADRSLDGRDAGLGGAEQSRCVQGNALQLVGLSSCALDLTGVLQKYNTILI